MRKPNIGLCAICQRALKPGDSVRPVLSGMAHAACIDKRAKEMDVK